MKTILKSALITMILSPAFAFAGPGQVGSAGTSGIQGNVQFCTAEASLHEYNLEIRGANNFHMEEEDAAQPRIFISDNRGFYGEAEEIRKGKTCDTDIACQLQAGTVLIKYMGQYNAILKLNAKNKKDFKSTAVSEPSTGRSASMKVQLVEINPVISINENGKERVLSRLTGYCLVSPGYSEE